MIPRPGQHTQPGIARPRNVRGSIIQRGNARRRRAHRCPFGAEACLLLQHVARRFHRTVDECDLRLFHRHRHRLGALDNLSYIVQPCLLLFTATLQ